MLQRAFRRGIFVSGFASLLVFGCSSERGADRVAPGGTQNPGGASPGNAGSSAPPGAAANATPAGSASNEPGGSGAEGTVPLDPALQPGSGVPPTGGNGEPAGPGQPGEPPAAGPLPLVFDLENTGTDCPPPPLPGVDQLPDIAALPDPFLAADGTRITQRAEWRCLRREVAARVQAYEMGPKLPRPSILQASLQGNQLAITAGEPDGTVNLTVNINRPAGAPEGPIPAVIGVANRTGSLPPDIFDSRGIASLQYDVLQLAAQFPGRGNQPYNAVYGTDTDAGAIIAWAWGVSRIIDALEQVPEAGIDTSHIAVTGCSYAGKIALYAGAFDERIRLTIPEESGGGGTAAWRVSEDQRRRGTDTENLATAQGTAWYHRDLPQFNALVDRLPFDHHQVLGMVAPRALLVVDSSSPFFPRLAHESSFTSAMAAREIWEALGVVERMGATQVSTNHCSFPATQRDEVEAFVDAFLLDREGVDTNVAESDAVTPDMQRWAPWETPALE